MDPRQTIEQALQEIDIAEAMIEGARQKYSSAKKKLQSLYTPVKKSRLSSAEIAKLLYKRPKKIQS